ncbi:hypothetical protein BOTBODRAFT_169745 [Botryobasidium botryosum FD-172 SS1]|uniref:F-box domain-containing protein n=1 Tax=Botryobasidium botryosum (strain FD-172 SS1) TaxID=930990 RepID=A0A067NBC5_BOTB1|nr:hypothetical protein BOTBODRAFT_169745 [Botryobasidium botryosum FD-172 SS1]
MIHSTKALADIHNHVATFLDAFQSIKKSLNEISVLDRCNDETHLARSFACQDAYIADAIHQLEHVIPSLTTPVGKIWSTFSVLGERCNAVAPINHLPNEILINIFDILCTPEFSAPTVDWSDDRVRQSYAISSIVSVSGVCKRWQKIVVEAPSLWGRVEIRDPPYTVAKLCVERSRDVPLTVDMRGDWDADAVAEAFMPSASRWKELSLECLGSVRAGHLISRFNAECDRSSAPLLRVFTLWRESIVGFYGDSGPPEELTCLPLASQLHSLIIKSVPFPSAASTCIRLTNLSISYTEIAVPMFGSALLACTELHTLHLLRVRHDTSTYTSPLVPAILPYLHDLKVEDNTIKISDCVFLRIRAPDLHTLSIRGSYCVDVGTAGGHIGGGHTHPVAQFMEQHTTIQILEIPTYLEEAVFDASVALPDVRTLILEDRISDINFSRHLLYEIPAHAFPQLSELRIESRDYGVLPAIQDFVSTRARVQEGTAPLALSIDCSANWSKREDVERIRAWLAEHTQLKSWSCPVWVSTHTHPPIFK